jgi:hypothetical protein
MRKLTLVAAFSALALSIAGNANAALTIVIEQSGADVIATTSGSFNTAGLTSGGSLMTPGLIAPSNGGFATTFSTKQIFTGLTGPASFGSGGLTGSFNNSGDGIIISAPDGWFGAPVGFVSGALSAVTTFENATFASLGLTAGSYVYTAPNDTVTIKIGALTAAVPEPASWALMIGGFGLAGAAMRRRAVGLRFA